MEHSAPWADDGQGLTGSGPKAAATDFLALALIARLHNIATASDQLAHEFAPDGVVDELAMQRAARAIGLHARYIRTETVRLSATPLPALARDCAGSWFVLAQFDGATGRALIQTGDSGQPEILSAEAFAQRWSGELVLIASRASLAGEWPASTSAGSCRPSSSTGD